MTSFSTLAATALPEAIVVRANPGCRVLVRTGLTRDQRGVVVATRRDSVIVRLDISGQLMLTADFRLAVNDSRLPE